uniref:Uncharacterized protein n=1 Tax=Myotis myotis TaxID=51298 RepID=A0A7J7Y0A7_MYOMY|nr:hypothetical protein mMyoMyo1_011438 [Myotis myotis]
MCFPMVLSDPCERVVRPPKGVATHRLRTAALVAPIKTQISGPHILFPLIFHFSTPSERRFPKPWSLWLSPLSHFSLTLSPLQAEHPLQMLRQSHQWPLLYSILCALPSPVLLHLSAAFNTIHHSLFGTLSSFGFQNSHSPDFLLSSLASPLAICVPLPDLGPSCLSPEPL